jgi:hypothetical protein
VRRKTAALLCAVILLAELVPVPARAVENVYFPAVNETLLEVTDATMPFWSGGYLYVCTTLFSNQELGVAASYNRYKQRAAVWRTDKPDMALIFTLGDNMVSDGKGNNYFPSAVTRNGNAFVPVSLIASFFGLTYSTAKVPHGYLIRLRSSRASLSDADLIDAGAGLLASRYSKYLKSRGGTASTPAAPSVQETPDAVPAGKTVRLCIRMSDAQSAGAVLSALSSGAGTGGAYATFYMTETQIRENGDLLRRMCAAGQGVGLIADGSAEVSPDRQLRSANEALFAAAGLKTRLCRIENAARDDVAAAEAAGYCVLAPDINRPTAPLRTSSGARTLLRNVAARSGAVTVWQGGPVTASALRTFLSGVQSAGGRLSVLTETS